MHILSPLLAVAQVFLDHARIAALGPAVELLPFLSLLVGDCVGCEHRRTEHAGWAASMDGKSAAGGPNVMLF